MEPATAGARHDEEDTSMSEHDVPATVESSLRLGTGFDSGERDPIISGWDRLTNRLASFPNGTVELEISVKERATPSQRTVLEASIAGTLTGSLKLGGAIKFRSVRKFV